MRVQENYSLPFSSEYEWRSALFQILKDLTQDALIDVLKEYKKDFSEVDWNDDYGLIEIAFRENIFEKVNALVLKKASEIE